VIDFYTLFVPKPIFPVPCPAPHCPRPDKKLPYCPTTRQDFHLRNRSETGGGGCYGEMGVPYYDYYGDEMGGCHLLLLRRRERGGVYGRGKAP